jgi:hypothetical protein
LNLGPFSLIFQISSIDSVSTVSEKGPKFNENKTQETNTMNTNTINKTTVKTDGPSITVTHDNETGGMNLGSTINGWKFVKYEHPESDCIVVTTDSGITHRIELILLCRVEILQPEIVSDPCEPVEYNWISIEEDDDYTVCN